MLNNKKILVLATTDNMIWQFLIPHIMHLQDRENEVECACAKTGFWFDELQTKYGFKMHQIDFTRNPLTSKNIKAYKVLKNLQKENNYEVIYCQQPVGGLMGRLLGKKFKIPVIYTAHGFHFYKNCSFKRKLIYKTAEKWLSKYTNALITINEEDYEVAKTFKAKKVYKINGIGFNGEKYPENLKREEARNNLKLKDEFVILTIAEMIKRKNYETIIKTINELKNENVKLLICGDGEEKKEVEEQIKSLGIEDKVSILGYRKDINNILLASDVFFLPSFQEGLTLSVIEAMHFGLPCVVSNVRGNRDLIENGKGGFVENPSNYVAFANHIKTLFTDKSLYELMSSYNKEQSKNYTIQFVKQQLDKVYDEIEI